MDHWRGQTERTEMTCRICGEFSSTLTCSRCNMPPVSTAFIAGMAAGERRERERHESLIETAQKLIEMYHLGDFDPVGPYRNGSAAATMERRYGVIHDLRRQLDVLIESPGGPQVNIGDPPEREQT